MEHVLLMVLLGLHLVASHFQRHSIILFSFPEPARQNAMTQQELRFPVLAQDRMEKFRQVLHGLSQDL